MKNFSKGNGMVVSKSVLMYSTYSGEADAGSSKPKDIKDDKKEAIITFRASLLFLVDSIIMTLYVLPLDESFPTIDKSSNAVPLLVEQTTQNVPSQPK